MLKSSFLTLFTAPICFRIMDVATKTVRDFGYDFNTVGQLRKIDKATGAITDLPFQFVISDKHTENQRNYEALGEAITEYVYGLLQSQSRLSKLPVPSKGPENLKSFVFSSEDFSTNTEKLLILIHGSGVVRAGQWARSMIINDKLDSGTQLPYIEKAKQLGYAVLVMNTNDNLRIINKRQVPIPCSKEPEEHASYVWEEYIKKSPAQFIGVVAHSYGGIVTVALAKKHPEFLQRVKAIAMTDSVHSLRRDAASQNLESALKKISRNWVSSHDPLDVPQNSENEITRVSAGHAKHEMTSYCAMSSVFKYIEDKFSENR